MSLYIRDTTSIPDGGWRYPHPASGFIVTYNYSILYEKVVETYRANNAMIPTLDAVIAWMCENLYIECLYAPNNPLINAWASQIPQKPTSCCGGFSMMIPGLEAI